MERPQRTQPIPRIIPIPQHRAAVAIDRIAGYCAFEEHVQHLYTLAIEDPDVLRSLLRQTARLASPVATT